jgi:hypothetical protein
MRAIKKIMGSEQGYTGFVETPTAKTYMVDIYVPIGKSISALKAKLGSGTSATIKLQKNGIDITGMTGLVVGNAAVASITPTSPSDGTNFLAVGDTLSVVVTAVTAPADLAFDIVATAT